MAEAQVNLVVDPSMEEYPKCPDTNSINEGCYTWHSLDSINNTPNAVKSCTPVYHNTCSSSTDNSCPKNYGQGYSFMYPRTGNGMYNTVFYCDPIACNPVYNRDYLRGRLREKLKNGQEYCGKFYVSLYKSMMYGVDRIGAYVDDGSLDQNYECLPIIKTPSFENPAGNIIKDTVTVNVELECDTSLQIPNVFSPNEDGVNDAWRFAIRNATDVKYSIYNRWGNLIKDSMVPSQTVVSWDGRTTAGEACPASVYYFVLTYTDAKGEAQKQNGYITLIK